MNLVRNAVVAVSLLVFPALGSATQADAPEPIDAWLENAISNDPSTAATRHATNQARELWDAEMNSVYSRLLLRLPEEPRDALRTSQRHWLRFRDSEGAVITQLIASKEGTMWQVVATEGSLELVKARTLQLREYESILDG